MGEKSSNRSSEITTAHGCIDRWRGSLSSRIAKLIVALINGEERSNLFNSGSCLIALPIFLALMCGIDFASRSIWLRSAPNAFPASLIAWRARYRSTIETVAHRL